MGRGTAGASGEPTCSQAQVCSLQTGSPGPLGTRGGPLQRHRPGGWHPGHQRPRHPEALKAREQVGALHGLPRGLPRTAATTCWAALLLSGWSSRRQYTEEQERWSPASQPSRTGGNSAPGTGSEAREPDGLQPRRWESPPVPGFPLGLGPRVPPRPSPRHSIAPRAALAGSLPPPPPPAPPPPAVPSTWPRAGAGAVRGLRRWGGAAAGSRDCGPSCAAYLEGPRPPLPCPGPRSSASWPRCCCCCC